MRVLKFRGKDKNTGEWIYSTGFLKHSTGVITMIVRETEDGFVTSPIDTETIGQFTGLLDKHGKEIYESDLVKTKHQQVAVIKWHHEYACFCYETVDEIVKDELQFSFKPEDIEILGNIHEHPHLLTP